MNDAQDSPPRNYVPLRIVASGKVSSGVETNIETRPESEAHIDAAMSAGSLLRQAREAAGLHIATLAVLLKVPAKKLEALEADRFDLLPDAVFARALASSVCRQLKMDASAVLQKLPQTGNPNLAYTSRGINTPFHGSGDKAGPSMWVHVSRPAVLAGLALLLGALVLVLLPTFKAGLDKRQVDTGQKAMNEQPSVSSAIGMVTDTLSAAVSQPQRPALSASSLSAAAILPLPPSAQEAVKVLPVPASAASAGSAIASTGIVVFTAKGPSWVQVSDAKGVVVLRRTLAMGEVVGATGVLPLSAIVGRADATQVQIRGNVFDLSAVAKDNVARFEVK